jgi:hypothetical protein
MIELARRKAKKKKRQRTIQAVLYFHTKGLPARRIKARHPKWNIKKVAWQIGTIALRANKRYRIRARKIQFNNIDELEPKLRQLLEQARIHLIRKTASTIRVFP